LSNYLLLKPVETVSVSDEQPRLNSSLMFVDVLRSRISLTLVDVTSKQYDDQVWTLKDINRCGVLTHEVLTKNEAQLFERNDRHLNEVSRQRRKITLYKKHISEITA